MTDKEIKEKFEEIEEAINILAKYTPHQIKIFSQKFGEIPFDQELATKCRDFVQKYGLSG
jgi:hypothetical protein